MLMARNAGSLFKAAIILGPAVDVKPSRVLSGTQWYGSIDRRSATHQAGNSTRYGATRKFPLKTEALTHAV